MNSLAESHLAWKISGGSAECLLSFSPSSRWTEMEKWPETFDTGVPPV